MADVLNAGKEVLNAASGVARNISTITRATAKTSLVRLTGDQVFQFPLIMDADIDDDEKFPIIKSIEKSYASLVMMAIVNHGFVDRDKYGSINKFLNQFHNNGDLPFNAKSFESFIGDSYDSDMIVTEAVAFEGTGLVAQRDLMKMWDCVEEQLDTSSINDMYQPYRFTKAKLERAYNLAIATEAAPSGGTTQYFRIPYNIRDREGRRFQINGTSNLVDVDSRGNPKWTYVEVPSDPTTAASMRQKYGDPKTVAEWRSTTFQSELSEYQSKKNIDRDIQDEINTRSDSRRAAEWDRQFGVQQSARQAETAAKNQHDAAEWNRRHGIERGERVSDQNDRNKFEQSEWNRRHGIERGERLVDQAARDKRESDEWDRRHGIERGERLQDQAARNQFETDEWNRRHGIERGERLVDQAHKDRIDAYKNISGSMVRDDKYNSLTPTILQMTLANGKAGVGAWSQQLIVGVRAMPRMLPQSLMVSNMTDAVKDRPIFKFIKWLKGEISWADLFTGIGNAKKEVTGNAKWLSVLRKRARRAKLRWLGFKLNPNCTIIITEADAHLIQERTGIDLHRTGDVQKLMDKYFLLGFGIYDTEAKMLNIIYDGESEFTHYSLRTMIADSKREANLLAMGRY